GPRPQRPSRSDTRARRLRARGLRERVAEALDEVKCAVDKLGRLLGLAPSAPAPERGAHSPTAHASERAREIQALEQQGLNPEEIGSRLGLATGEVMAIKRRCVR